MTTYTCPRCKGKKILLVKDEATGRNIPMSCTHCMGEGVLSDDMLELEGHEKREPVTRLPVSRRKT